MSLSALRARRGVTLLELLVVLVLLGLAVGLAAPALTRALGDDAPTDPRAPVIAAARALAIRRAEALTLDVRADGAWTAAARDSVLRAGTVPPGAALRLAISPLGTCVAELADAPWDAGRCAPVEPAR